MALVLAASCLFIPGAARAQAIPVARADVDRDCTVTRTDATLVQAQNGRRTGQAGFNPNADVDRNGVVNSIDITFVTRNLGASVCSSPAPAPTISASVAPAANANGWHRSDVTITFSCSNATSCPAAVTVTAEGSNQVVERAAVNAAGVTATARVTLNIDKTAPVLAAIVPSSAVPGTSMAIPLTATDLSGLARSTLLVGQTVVDSRAAAPFGLALSVPGSDAVGLDKQLEIIGEDRAGNVASIRRSVRLESRDTQAPTVALTAPASAAPGATVPIVVQAADDRSVARVVLSRSDSTGSTVIEERTAAPFAFQSITEIPAATPAGATVTFAAVATDAAGNSAAGAAAVHVVTSVATTTLQVTVDPPVSPTFQASGVISGTINRGTTSAPPAAPPIIAAVSPASVNQGQTVDIAITGIATEFGALSQVSLGPGIAVLGVTVVDASHLIARVSVAANAGVGPRVVAVSTGTREALLASAFSVAVGRGSATGRVLNAAGQPVVNAQVCLAGTSVCVFTGADGRFTFADVAADTRRVTVLAGGYESLTLDLALAPNLTATVGDIPLTTSNLPPPPPLPNSPPVAPKLAVVLGRGAAAIGPGGNREELRRLVRDTFIAVGGREIGVLDASGQQLNPLMVGAGYASVTSEAIDEIADEMIAGDTISLAKLFQILVGSLEFPATVPLPTLAQLIGGFQGSVDAVWANPARPDAPLLMVLFNQGRVASSAPPRVTFDTQFNALQKHLVTVSFVAFVHRFLNPANRTALLEPVAPAVNASIRWTDRVRRVASLLLPQRSGAVAARGFAPVAWTPPVARGGGLPRSLRGGRPVYQQSANPYLPGDAAGDRPASLMWESVVAGVLPSGGWTAAKNGGKLCDSFLVQLATSRGFESVDGKSPLGQELAKDPNAKFLPAPQCKTVIELLEILTTAGSKTATEVGKQYGKFFASEGATALTAQRLEQQFTSQAYKDAFAAAKAEARAMNISTRSLAVVRGLAEGALTKLQGAVVDTIFALEVNLVIESLRPRQPFIIKIEQMTDPQTAPPLPSRLVKITFSRSPNDKGVYDDADIRWWYELYRGRSGAVQPVAGREFDKKAKELVFYDEVPDDGTYVYAIRGRRQVGYPLGETTVENPFVTKTLDFLGGFFNTTVKIGGQAVFGLEIVKTVTTPLADIYKGVRLQYSDFSDPEQLYVSTRPPTPRPPANLAVHPNGSAFLSVPSLNMIFRVTDGVLSPFANHNFKEPGAAGLAIDSIGDLYSDNAASDAQFGGRVFSFRASDGFRDLAGNVNYYSQLISFANPVSVQSMVVGNGFYGEELFIADAQGQRITHMTLPRRFGPGGTDQRNISQLYAQSPLFQFGPSTAMAISPNLGLAVTQGNNVMLVPLPGVVQSLFDAAGAPSPFSELSGVTFDTYGNMYVSDAVAGTISMIPTQHQYAYHGLAGVSAIERKKLTVLRGARRPSDVKLASKQDGLAFFDGERAFASLRFGMAGQLTNEAGAALAGATVYAQDARKLAVTDGDGIFVLPDLVMAGGSPIIDFVVRYEGKTRSYRRVLDTFRHNIVDVVFTAPDPPPPSPPTRVDPPVPPPSTPPQTKPSGAETVSVAFELTTGPAPPVDPGAAGTFCPRVVFLAPASGAGVLTPTTTVSGLLSDRHLSAALSLSSVTLMVNGVATTLPLSNGEFSTTVALATGENALSVALPASLLKPVGCADPALDDTALVTVSSSHRVFHDPRPDELARYRSGAGFDRAVRGIVRDYGFPIAGLTFQVPGTDYTGTTDGDGVFQVELPSSALAGSASAVDRLAHEMFTRVAGIVTLLRSERRADALAALQSLLAQAMAVADNPPPAASTVDALLARVLQAEGTARSLIQALESSGGMPNPADIDALEAVGQQLAGTDSNGQIVVRGREYPQLSISVNVQ